MQDHLPLPFETDDQEPDIPIVTDRDSSRHTPRERDGRRRREIGARTRGTHSTAGSGKLLSVEEAALLLDTSRATLYRAIKRGDLPLPLFLIGRRLRIPRAAIDKLLAGEWPTTAQSELRFRKPK